MDTSFLKVFSARLRETRGDMMQATFAQKIGVSRASLSSYENGFRIPDIETLKRVYEATGISLYYLLGLTDSKDDALATTQKETGLSENALIHFANDRFSSKVVNHLVECGQMSAFARRAAEIHDDALLYAQYSNCEIDHFAKLLQEVSLDATKNGMLNGLIEAMSNIDIGPEPFGFNPEHLPSRVIEKYSQKPQLQDELNNILSPEEAPHAQETPES